MFTVSVHGDQRVAQYHFSNSNDYNEWNHLVLTKNDKTFNTYLNSNLINSIQLNTIYLDGTNYEVTLGARHQAVNSLTWGAQKLYLDRITLEDHSDSSLDNHLLNMTKQNYLSAMSKYKKDEDFCNDLTFVKKISGKDLSTNDYTSAEATKLSGIESGAQVNILESISVNNTLITPTDKNINIDMTNYGTLADISSAFKYKGSVASFSLLPLANQEVGDVYNIEAADATNGINAGDNVAWNGTGWDVLAGGIDMSNYVQVEQGKGLSHIDVTQEMKDAWDSIESDSDVTQTEIDNLFS